MIYRKLTADGDMTFGNGLLDFYINNPAAVGQAVETRLKLWLGEWFVDVTQGTQYQTNVLGTGKATSAGPTIRQRILETQGVTEITKFDLNIDVNGRSLSIVATINTIYGTTNIQVIT
ncbi:MAG: hypothetical protein IPP74_14330 [Alphaproteobacteria bacterium]|nr:hypothetical protein [Alphaproteobacteria bacterium]